jgi:hypothetical protein
MPAAALAASETYLELDVFVLQHLDVEPNRGDGLDVFFAVVLKPI